MNTSWNWHRLSELCEQIHFDLYTRKLSWNDIGGVDALRNALSQLPNNPDAIVWQEAMALLKESEGEFEDAIRYRMEECSLIESLHRSLDDGPYDAETVAIMLRRRTREDLKQRKLIIQFLRQEKVRGTNGTVAGCQES